MKKLVMLFSLAVVGFAFGTVFIIMGETDPKPSSQVMYTVMGGVSYVIVAILILVSAKMGDEYIER